EKIEKFSLKFQNQREVWKKLIIWLMCIVIVNDYLLRAARKSEEMLEPYEGKLSRTVLREEGGSNTTNLLD
ncbi:hypothetical protein JXW99_05620, partial [Streptococcus suis]|nr:hypothetical protein [Streptococcus suis]